MENLLAAWREFRRGKRYKLDVLEFQSDMIYHITALREDLRRKAYKHGSYKHFRISDPKPRDIHKASVRDRLLHHAVYRALYPYFDKAFIHDSYSCRLTKGTHRAMNKFLTFARKVSRNHTRTCWVLKCDIRKFFASIDHGVLFDILERHVADRDILWLLTQVVGSFASNNKPTNSSMLVCRTGLPLGNLTSQLLVNVYMNEFDQFVKHKLKARYYIRYADDFVILSHKKAELERTLLYMEVFLKDTLRLELHQDKTFIKTFTSRYGLPGLGTLCQSFANHRVLRTATKRRMARRLRQSPAEGARGSYLGMLKHGSTEKVRQKIFSILKV